MSISRRKFLKIGIAASILPYESHAKSIQCAEKTAKVYVGGVTGFNSLADPSHSRQFRETCRAGLYIHGYIWDRTDIDVHRSVLSAFSQTPIDVELGLDDNSAKWFEVVYRPKYLDVGVRAQHAHVNGFHAGRLEAWGHFVQAAKNLNISTIAPIFSPNSQQYKGNPFSRPSWDFLREGATMGGALTTDSPPHFFLQQTEDYRRFVVDEIRWANSTELHSTFIVSPNSSGPAFLEETKRTVDFLSKHNALPKAWVVENYDPNAAQTYINSIGTENNAENVLGVALWLSENAPTA